MQRIGPRIFRVRVLFIGDAAAVPRVFVSKDVALHATGVGCSAVGAQQDVVAVALCLDEEKERVCVAKALNLQRGCFHDPRDIAQLVLR